MLNTLPLAGKKGIVTGLANADSIAHGCARVFFAQGADLILSYGHPKAKTHVQPLADALNDAPLVLCDVREEEQMEALFNAARKRWGKLDFLVHSIANAPKADLQGRLIDSSREGFLEAMDISCHSFMRLARHAEPLLHDGGCLLTMSFLGAERVVENYNLMGPVKAALESSVRYLAHELGPQGVRVHAISPGPVATRASSGLRAFDELLARAGTRAPLQRLVTTDDIGAAAAFLVSDAAAAQTGATHYVDGGLHILS
jgi:enoyl-[acyl-carrier protein] reductase I